jgi:hypothetical protein
MRSTTGKVGNYEREAARSEYASLLRSTLPAVIRSAAENEDHIARLEELDREGSRMSAAERRLAELLPLLVEDCTESFSRAAATRAAAVLLTTQISTIHPLKSPVRMRRSDSPAHLRVRRTGNEIQVRSSSAQPQPQIGSSQNSTHLHPSRVRLLVGRGC